MTDDRAGELRDAFDRSFAEPPRAAPGAEVELLRVRIGGRPHVIAIADIASLHAGVKITALPALAGSGALGVVAIRGAIVPVYDLGVLLGVAGQASEASAALRWIAVAGGDGYAFDGLDGFMRVPTRPAPGGAVVHDGRPHPVVELTGAERRRKDT